MKIAFVDLLFSWPPNGGADVDLYNTAAALQRAGHETQLFVAHLKSSWERGACDPDALPFPAQRLDFTRRDFTVNALKQRLQTALTACAPDAVLLCDGFFLKHRLHEVLAPYPYAIRYYAYEMACHRNILRYRDGSPCAKAYLDTPDFCRQCALSYLGPDLRAARRNAWIDEYLIADASNPDYRAAQTATLRGAAAAIVYNEVMAALLSGYTETHVVPGGVDLEAFPYCPRPRETDHKTILMTGRGEDPMKGAAVLLEAGERLRAERSDFTVQITMPEDTAGPGWFHPVGRHSHAGTCALYTAADIVVVPSVWEEPFGMVAVEAMAVGRPVCASRTGGLQHIVRDRETGLLYDRGDAAALAAALKQLLDDAHMRHAMGNAARARVETEYTWDHIVAQHYPAILDRLARETAL